MTKSMTPAASYSPPKYTPPAKPFVSHLPLLRLSDLPSNILMQTLGQALTLRRGHGTVTEGEFVAWLVNRLPVTLIDGAGNIHVDRRPTPTCRTLFTSHTDTVHRAGGANAVRIDGEFWRADGAALGADDGSGIALMCHMIERGVPGYYIFFRGEECGGVGSSWLAENMEELLEQFDRAVAFDRAGYHDVITHQSGGRCCSDEFAEALGRELTTDDFTMAYVPCDGGVYTDTAEFVRVIPECTNLSVGYKSQHGEWEEQDVGFLVRLARQLVQVDWDRLPTARDPKVRESKYGRYSTSKYFDSAYSNGYYPSDWDHAPVSKKNQPVGDPEVQIAIATMENYIEGVNRSALVRLIAEYVMPDDPTSAERLISPRLLTDEVVIDGMDSLEAGWEVDSVMLDMFDMCTEVR